MSTKHLALAAVAACACLVGACGTKADHAADEADHAMPDTLRVATLYSPTSYFIFRDEEMGYDFNLASDLALQKGMVLDLRVAPSLNGALAMLDSGLVDLVAYEVPVTSEFKERVVHCGPSNETTQVLVQPRRGASRITDVTGLVGRDVYVESGSKYEQRIRNLDQELGGGINIHIVDKDTIITEDLIGMVSDGEIPLTIVDSDIARINKTFYPDLDINLQVSFPQVARWAVRKDLQWLADSIDAWFDTDAARSDNASLLKRYFELSKRSDPEFTVDLSRGFVSPYDAIFRKYASQLGWDWHVLAAIAFVESRFKADIVGWTGATGLMQVMPSTARNFNVDPAALIDPEVSISTASKVLASLERTFKNRVPDPHERIKFILAAYNSGPGHIIDAINLAKLIGKDPEVWTGNVEEALKLKSNPKYFNDPVVKCGYFRSKETSAYVKQVNRFADRISKIK